MSSKAVSIAANNLIDMDDSEDDEEADRKKAKFLEKRKTCEYHEYPTQQGSNITDEDVQKPPENRNEIDCDDLDN